MSQRNDPFRLIAARRLFALCEQITEATHDRDAWAAGLRLHRVPDNDLDVACFLLEFERRIGEKIESEDFRIDREGVWSSAEALTAEQTDAIYRILSTRFAETATDVATLFNLYETHEKRVAEEDTGEDWPSVRVLTIEDHLLV